MKIAFLLGAFPSPSESFIVNQIAGLKSLGLDLQILASRKDEGGISHPAINSSGLMKIVHFYNPTAGAIKRIGKGFRILLFVNGYREFGKYWKAVRLRSLRDLFLVNDFLKLIHPPAIIHAHFGPNGILGARLKRWDVFRGKLITTFHGYDMSAFLEMEEKVYEIVFQEGDLFLPISKFFGEKLMALGCPEKKIIIHRMGIDLDRYKFSSKVLKEKECIKLLSVARFVEKKGLEFSLRALAIVRAQLRGHKLEYYIVGDGKLKRKYEEIIERESLADHAFLLGWKTQDEVSKLMNECHIFILPSITASNGDMEGIPVSLMEAMACGMPVISTYHSGIPELVADGKSGLLVPEKDADALAESLLYLLKKPGRWSEMGRSGRKIIEREYDIEKLNRRLVKIYQQVLAL